MGIINVIILKITVLIFSNLSVFHILGNQGLSNFGL